MIDNMPDNSVPTMINLGGINQGKAALFLFTPRQIVDHYKRPLMYNFNNEVATSIAENIVENPSMHGIDKVLKSPSVNSAIIPDSRNGIGLATSQYSDHWTFVAIVDESIDDHFASNAIVNRHILIGICGTEPIAQNGLSSATPEQFLNPNCQLIVTRKLMINRYSTAGVNGVQHNLKTITDTSTADYHTSVWNPANEYYSMSPECTIKSTVADNEGYTSIVDSSDSLNVKQSLQVSAPMESPRRHLKCILNGLDDANSKSLYSSQIGEFGDSSGLLGDQDENFEEYAKSSIAATDTLGKAVYYNQGGIDGLISTGYLSIGMINSQYCPKVLVIQTPTHTPAEIIPQYETSINNVFSSLVCACLPTYLNSVGLSAISFMYNSAADATQVLNIESVVASTQQDLHFKWGAFLYILQTELFPILIQNGNFDIQANCSVNSTTNVILNFLDFSPLPAGSVYEENSVLGGIVSPLIGTKAHMQQNSLQLNDLIKSISASSFYKNNLYGGTV